MLKVNYRKYRAFGYSILSEILLPELSVDSALDDKVDIEIKTLDLSNQWNQLAPSNKNFIETESMIMFRIPRKAIFCVQNGNKIIVSPLNEYNQDECRLYILGTCMGIILFQRKILPLHGSVVAVNNGAYAIVGDSGAGKSTLASAFLKRGFQLLTDDVIAVSFSNENVPYVMPSYPQQKLWDKSLSAFGMNAEQFKPLFERETKYAVPVPNYFISKPLPLVGIFELLKTVDNKIYIEKIEGMNKLRCLFTNTYRNFLIRKLGLLEWHLKNSIKISDRVNIYKLQRPTDRFSAYELIDIILNTISGGTENVKYAEPLFK